MLLPMTSRSLAIPPCCLCGLPTSSQSLPGEEAAVYAGCYRCLHPLAPHSLFDVPSCIHRRRPTGSSSALSLTCARLSRQPPFSLARHPHPQIRTVALPYLLSATSSPDPGCAASNGRRDSGSKTPCHRERCVGRLHYWGF